MVMQVGAQLAAKGAKAAGKAAITKALAKKKATSKRSAPVYRRRRVRLLTMGQKEELAWISRHLGRTAAAERIAHYRR